MIFRYKQAEIDFKKEFIIRGKNEKFFRQFLLE